VKIPDAIVVGAGPTGAIAAERLASHGFRVDVLEAGPRPPRGARLPEVDRRAWKYEVLGGSFDWYRVRAVGGRAHLWGGWSYRLADHVLNRGGFPFRSRTLAPLYDELESRLGVVEGTLDERYRALAKACEVRVIPKRGAGSHPWTPLCLPSARLAKTWSVALSFEHSKGVATALNTIDLRTGQRKRRKARAFILAASPIETARVLLESELGTVAHGIGRNLVDHMVASYLLLEPAPPPSLEGRGIFPGSALVEGFVNVGPGTERPYRGGFSVEICGPVSLESLGVDRMVPSDEVGRWRATQLHALGEMLPHERRFVDLHPTERDALGRLLPCIHVDWSDEEKTMAEDMRRACVQIADALAVPSSRVIPFLDPLLAQGTHEAGTCSMAGEDPVCDAQGGLRALSNVWIADASAMPTSGDRHPTLTLLAHALRASDGVARSISTSM